MAKLGQFIYIQWHLVMIRHIHPYKNEFPAYLTEYMGEIKEAIKTKAHHDNRRHLFINFLRLGFDIDPVEIQLEKKIKVAEVRGRIDAFFKSAIFEFKTDLEREREAGKLELKKYFEAQPDPQDYIALLTDGLLFEVFQYEKGQVQKINEFKLIETDPLLSFRYLDQFVFSSQPIKPVSNDIVQRFGLHSPVFNSSRVLLESIYEKIKGESTLKIKIKEWNTLLAKVYGSEIGDIPLFLKHTYLTMLSRLIVSKTLFPKEILGTAEYKGLLTGEFFKKKNLPNLVEPDFFSWALETSEENSFISFLAKLEGYLIIYKLSDIGEDILKEIYQELVDPESRHALGEYYTPDWLAELTLEAIDYKNGRLLDPACGSGTFLFNAIKRMRKSGAKAYKLLEDALSSITGIDVHPLAVMMSKVNMLLALNKEIKKYPRQIYLHVYLSDTLLIEEDVEKQRIAVPVSDDENFYIPLETIKHHINIDELIDKLSSFAHKVADGADLDDAIEGLEKTAFEGLNYSELFYWRNNFKLLVKLIKQKRNSIWPFILKNAYRPAFLRLEKVDYLVGNPPWLAYRYIKDNLYKARIKELTFDLHLLDKKDVKLFTQMDTSTVFFNYCEREYLKQRGKIAFVMPKTTILPSKQHILFQSNGFSEIHDFSGVSPLFNVRAVVLVRNRKRGLKSKIPITFYEGNLPLKNLPLNEAKKFLSFSKGIHDFLEVGIKSPEYHKYVFQGATIVPRCFWFVQPAKGAAFNREAPYFETSDEAFEEAKDKWRMRVDGRIEKKYIFETVLAKGILPFVISRREMVFLPLKVIDGRTQIIDASEMLRDGKENGAEWLLKLEKIWNENSGQKRDIYERLDYNATLTNQIINYKYVLLYNTSGSNLTAALYFPNKNSEQIKINGFAADAKTYYFYPKNIREGHYLCAMLNSDIVNERIKAYQPQGLYGERDIHRRPFEVCPIPPFDSDDPEHKRLVELGRECQKIMKKYAPKMEGRLGNKRLEAKKIISVQITEINKIVASILKQHGQDDSNSVVRRKRKTNPTLF